MFFFPFWGVWSCSSCTVSELAQPLPCGWVAGLLEFCRVKLSNVGPGQCLDGRPKSFLPWLQEEREPSFRTAPCRAFAHICRDVADFSVTAFASNSCNLLLQMLVNPAFASAFVQFEVFASTTYFCSVGWFLLQPCMQPLAHTLLKTSWEWRNCKYVCLKTSFSALKTGFLHSRWNLLQKTRKLHSPSLPKKCIPRPCCPFLPAAKPAGQ